MRGKRAKEFRRWCNANAVGNEDPFSFSHVDNKSLKPPYHYEEGMRMDGSKYLQRMNKRLRRYQKLKETWTRLPVPIRERMTKAKAV